MALRERPAGRDALNQISTVDEDVLTRIWRELGHMGKWQIRDYTHDRCPEWEDPQGSSRPISFERIFTALGRSADDAALLAERIAEQYRVTPCSPRCSAAGSRSHASNRLPLSNAVFKMAYWCRAKFLTAQCSRVSARA